MIQITYHSLATYPTKNAGRLPNRHRELFANEHMGFEKAKLVLALQYTQTVHIDTDMGFSYIAKIHEGKIQMFGTKKPRNKVIVVQ